MGQILLVRHGQASFGAEDYDVLSEIGWAQGRRLGASLAEQRVAPTAMVRGDMRRHRETAEAMIQTAGWESSTTVDDGWDEFDHVGIVASYPELPEDLARADLDRRTFQHVFEAATARWIAGAPDDYPETYADFVARVRAAFGRACESAGAGRTVTVVTSGGPIAVVCAALADPEADPDTAARLWTRFNTVLVNTGVTRVVVGATGPRLLTYNEHAHLDREHVTYR